GSLKEASLADVCQLLAMGRKTGCLSVTDRTRFGQVYFEDGRITYARIVNRRDRLGDMLVADGAITHDQLQEAIERQAREPQRRLGELLIDEARLTREELERYLRRQIEEAVYYLFTWSQGNFYFEANERPEEGEVLVSIPPESLLLEGARRIDEWNLIAENVPSFDLIFEVDRARLDEADVELTPEQERILPLIDGSRTVQQLVDETGLIEFDVGKALFGLVQAGFARRIGSRPRLTEGPARQTEIVQHRNLIVAFYRAGLLDDAEREAKRVLEADEADEVARFYLALLAVRQDREDEAIERLRALLEETGPRYGTFVDLAVALQRAGRSADAELVLGEAESLRPESPVIALLRGVMRLEADEVEEAIAHFEAYREGLEADATPTPAYFHYAALAALLAGDASGAEARLREGLDAHPRSAPLLVLEGAIAERRGDLDAAERSYRRAAEEDGGLAQAHKNLGDVAYRRGLHDEAETHYERALRLAPELGDDVYTRLGNLRYKRRELDEAVECWERALELNPENRVARNNMEIAAHAAG
ncbi:MAG: DUF4388 domain-containing protein, partial [Gemmatimonadota bacterium]